MWPFTRKPTQPPPGQGGPADRRLLSILPPDQARALGRLPPDAVLGEVRGDGSEQVFTPNPGFIALLHETLRQAGAGDADLRRAARDQGEGWVYVIDLRTPDGPHGNVPFEDIVGGFKVMQGLIDPAGYWQNDKYLPWTATGMMRLPPALHAAVLRAVLDGAARS